MTLNIIKFTLFGSSNLLLTVTCDCKTVKKTFKILECRAVILQFLHMG
jgi:hypothetical protein